jgi:hypothetical protein
LHFDRLFPVLAGEGRDTARKLGLYPVQLEPVWRSNAQLAILVIEGDKRLNPGRELLRRQLKLQLGGAGLPEIFHESS